MKNIIKKIIKNKNKEECVIKKKHSENSNKRKENIKNDITILKIRDFFRKTIKKRKKTMWTNIRVKTLIHINSRSFVTSKKEWDCEKSRKKFFVKPKFRRKKQINIITVRI